MMLRPLPWPLARTALNFLEAVERSWFGSSAGEMIFPSCFSWSLTRRMKAPDTVVVALSRGGVPVGFAVAKALQVALDVLVVRKLGKPGHDEYAMRRRGGKAHRARQAVASGACRMQSGGCQAALSGIKTAYAGRHTGE
jgi:hypothetical protein